MSAGGAFGGNRGARPVPPEKGVFPLDHLHLCDLEKKEYISCLKTSGHKSEICRPLSKKYLECRMAKLVSFFLVKLYSQSSFMYLTQIKISNYDILHGLLGDKIFLMMSIKRSFMSFAQTKDREQVLVPPFWVKILSS